MTRNSLTDIDSGDEAWDVTINANNEVLQDNPLPIVEYATIGSMPSAGLHDRSIAMGNHAEIGWAMFMSDGSNFILPPVPWCLYAAVANLSAPSSVVFAMETYDTTSLGVTFPATTKVIGCSVVAVQYDGVDRGDWTLTCTNASAATSAAFAGITFSSSLGVRQTNKGRFGASGLSFSAGDILQLTAAGPAYSVGLALGVTFWGVTYHDTDWPTS